MVKNFSSDQSIELHVICDFIARNIERDLHDKILARIPSITLDGLLRRENPYLIKVGGSVTAGKFIEATLDEVLGLHEEVVLANFLAKIAIFVCKLTHAGRKSKITGIDLEFKRGAQYYIIAFGNAPIIDNNQQHKIRSNFTKAIVALSKTKKLAKKNIVAIECTFYGNEDAPKKSGYQRLCGQHSWKLLSGRDELYRELIAPLRNIKNVRSRNLTVQRAKKINSLTAEFLRRFSQQGVIERDKLVGYCFGSIT